MSEKTYKRVTLTYDFSTEVTDEEAVLRLIDTVSEGEVLNYFVQDLPDLGWGRWLEL